MAQQIKHPDKTKESDSARQADQAKHQASHKDHENLLAQSKQVVVDIRTEITRLKSEPAWASGDRHGVSLVKGDGINVALMLLKKGAKLSDIDGVRVSTKDGWWLLRASNTQPVLVARCEAADEAGLERLKGALKAALSASGVSLPDEAAAGHH